MLRTRHHTSLLLTLTVLWWLLSGHAEPLLLCLGGGSVLLTLVLARRLDVVDPESQPVEIGLYLLRYWWWLGGQIISSNLVVARHILSPKLDLSPTLLRLPPVCYTDIGRTILANSITLTPGTVALSVEPDGIRVHALTRDLAEQLQRGNMAARVPEPGIRQ